MTFTHDTLGQRVILDAGGARRHLAEELKRLGASRAMLIAGPVEQRMADEVSAGLPVAVRWSEVVQHVPVEVAERARKAAVEAGVDALLSVGGGSTTGLAKAIALTTRLPIVAVPTTYAGSEATAVWGLTQHREKRTGLDTVVLPVTVVYDATLTLSLPIELSVASGFNGLAHCVDSMWAPGTDPINQALALEGIRALAAGLPKVMTEPEGIDGRNQCLYGAYLSAVSFASAGSGLHHKVCHFLGGAYNLPHAETHAIVLPHVLAYNAPAVPDIARRIAQAFGAQPGPDDDPARAAVNALLGLRDEVDAPRALKDVGMQERDILDAAARIMPVVPPSNPTPVSQESMQALLRAAWLGDTPGDR
jgi:alcohol dehydrogenase class IV